jgi:hypothetical protein
MTTGPDRRTTLPSPSPLDVDWQYNGDFWEIGFHERIADDEDGYREGEWIVLATVNLGCSLDPEAEDTWKVVHQIGCLMAAAPRMRAALGRVRAMMETEPDQFSFDERVDVEGALDGADHEAVHWTFTR